MRVRDMCAMAVKRFVWLMILCVFGVVSCRRKEDMRGEALAEKDWDPVGGFDAGSGVGVLGRRWVAIVGYGFVRYVCARVSESVCFGDMAF